MKQSIRPIPKTIEELNQWAPSIEAPSRFKLAISLAVAFSLITLSVGLTFTQLHAFNVVVSQVVR